ncbi:MAG: hypothetical protein ACOZCL_10525 [Bacillota bacterium]
MSKSDFNLYLFACPILGGFVGFILSSILAVGESSAGIMIMLGMMASYFPLIVYILGTRFLDFTEEKDTSKDK